MAERKVLMKRVNQSKDGYDDYFPVTHISLVQGYDANVAGKLSGNTVVKTSVEFTQLNPTLLAGQYGSESNTGYMKVGDGTTAWNNLPYISMPIGGSNMSIEVETTGGSYAQVPEQSMSMEVYNEETGEYEEV